MNRRITVTGATGFIGGHFVSRLLADGWDVSVLVRPGSTVSSPISGAKVLRFTGNTEDLVGLLARAEPDVVVHLASLFIAEHQTSQVEALIESNVLFGAQLLEAMHIGGVDALVNVGTSWQHYRGADYDPVCLYAATKQAFEDIALYYCNACSMRMQSLHLPDTYGPGDQRRKLFTLLSEASRSGETLQMSGGNQLLDLLHVSDVVQGLVKAVERVLRTEPGWHEVNALSSGCLVSLRDVVELWQSVTGRTLSIEWGGRPYREREVMAPWQGPVLEDWRSLISLDSGFRELIAWEERFRL